MSSSVLEHIDREGVAIVRGALRALGAEPASEIVLLRAPNNVAAMKVDARFGSSIVPLVARVNLDTEDISDVDTIAAHQHPSAFGMRTGHVLREVVGDVGLNHRWVLPVHSSLISLGGRAVSFVPRVEMLETKQASLRNIGQLIGESRLIHPQRGRDTEILDRLLERGIRTDPCRESRRILRYLKEPQHRQELGISKSVVADYETAIEVADWLNTDAMVSAPSLAHGDFWTANIGKRLTLVSIDTDTAGAGHNELDVGRFRFASLTFENWSVSDFHDLLRGVASVRKSQLISEPFLRMATIPVALQWIGYELIGDIARLDGPSPEQRLRALLDTLIPASDAEVTDRPLTLRSVAAAETYGHFPGARPWSRRMSTENYVTARMIGKPAFEEEKGWLWVLNRVARMEPTLLKTFYDVRYPALDVEWDRSFFRDTLVRNPRQSVVMDVIDENPADFGLEFF